MTRKPRLNTSQVVGLVGNKQSKGYYKNHEAKVSPLDVEKLKTRASTYVQESYDDDTNIVTLTGKLGAGVGVHFSSLFGTGIAEIKITDVCNSNGECGVENSNSLRLDFYKKAGIGGEATSTVDIYGNRKEQYFVGVYAGDHKLGLGDLPDTRDLIISLGGGLYVGPGGEFELSINLTKLYNYLKK